VFRPCNLESLSTPKKSGVLGQNLILELLQILQPLLFFLLFYKPLLLNFFSCFGLSHLSCLLNSSLNVAGLYYLFQVGLEPLFLFMPLLYFLVLLFKHISVILGNTGRNGRRHDNIEERQKKFFFLFIYCWPKYYHRFFK